MLLRYSPRRAISRNPMSLPRLFLPGRQKSSLLAILPEVEDALRGSAPVVALESTIISHGMPYPRNFEVAQQVENVIRDNGAIPATIAIIGGIPKIGLNEKDLLILARNNMVDSDGVSGAASAAKVIKASTRDIGFACAKGMNASTTVASTMRLAHMAGISVFATGGIGGVHRGVQATMDVSADLLELSRTPVTVVSAGIKSILDIAKTLEVLESSSVPVYGYRCDEFPAFFTNESGIRSHRRVDSATEIASIMAMNYHFIPQAFQNQQSSKAGMLIGVPNPAPADSAKIQYAIDFALQNAKDAGLPDGPGVTPYLLAKVQELTGGKSLDANISLVLNNALVASEIAVAYQKELASGAMDGISVGGILSFQSNTKSTVSEVDPKKHSSTTVPTPKPTYIRAGADAYADPSSAAAAADLVVVGGAVVDFVGRISSPIARASQTIPRAQSGDGRSAGGKTHYSGSSNPGRLRSSYGGVGRNIAEFGAKLGLKVSLATAVADDDRGRNLLAHSENLGLDLSLVKVVPVDSVEPAVASSSSSSSSSIPIAAHPVSGSPGTAVYNAIHDSDGDLCVGLADMEILSEINTHYVKTLAPAIQNCKIVAVDANLSSEAFSTLMKICTHYNIPVFFEPTSDHKCLLPFHANSFGMVDIMKPNISELVRIANHCVQLNLVAGSRALVSNTLSNIVANRINSESVDDIDLVDVRILANAVYEAMVRSGRSSAGTVSLGGQNQRADRDSTRGNSGPSSSSAAAGRRGTTNVPGPVPILLREGRNGAANPVNVLGKHLIVSLGKRGVLWCGPARAFPRTQQTTAVGRSSSQQQQLQHQASSDTVSSGEVYHLIVDRERGIGSCYFEAAPLDATQVLGGGGFTTNGAGDAFCAGLIAEMIRKSKVPASEGEKRLQQQPEDAAVAWSASAASTIILPDMDCIRAGLANAHARLLEGAQ